MSIKKSRVGRQPVYDQSIKSSICFDVLSGRLTYSEATRIYAIKGKDTVRRWVKQYEQQCNLHQMMLPDNTIPDNDNQLVNNEELQRKTQELEEALKMAKLKIRALETMIDIAESQLNIEIRKKSGTKQ
jgi:transposase-like protein